MAKPKNANTQHARFLKTARALGCDEDETAFDEKLKSIAPPKTRPAPPVKDQGK